MHTTLTSLLLIVFSTAPSLGLAFGASPSDSLKVPRTAVDSVARRAADSSAVRDSLGVMSTPSLVGTLDRNLDTLTRRTRNDLHWIDYRYLGGVLESFPGVFIRDQSGEGQYNQINVHGTDWRGVAVTSNGRLLNDPASGVYNLYYFTTEYADRIEMVSGPRAFIYGLNSTGAAINVVTKNYNSNVPYTKLDYAQGAYLYGTIDGTFSQNVSRKVNVTLGFQHQTTDGRFENSAHDAWNSRAKIRYNVSKNFNIVFSHYFTSTQTGLNGGIDPLASGFGAFDPILAVVRNSDSYEKVTRHDFDLSFVGTFFGDTANVTTLTTYYSHNLREYRDEENRSLPNGIFIQSDHVSSWSGLSLTQNFDSPLQRFAAGGNLEVRQIEGSPNLGRQRDLIGALWAREELNLGDLATVAGFGRYDQYLHRGYGGLGADATLRLTEEIHVFGGISTSHRVPTYQELFWRDSTVLRSSLPVAEGHRVAEAGVTVTLRETGTVRLSYLHRTVSNPITFTPYTKTSAPFPGIQIANGPDIVTNAVSASIFLRLWALVLEGTAEYLVQRSGGGSLSDLPTFSGRGGLFFWSKLVHDKLEVKTGFKGRYTSSYRGQVFNPELLAYVPNAGQALGASSSVDFFLIGHIGDAYVQFMWENLTDIKYYSTPFYPAGERAIRFGVFWEFLN